MADGDTTIPQSNPVREAFLSADEEAKTGDPDRAIAKASVLACLVVESGLEKIAIGLGWRPTPPSTSGE